MKPVRLVRGVPGLDDPEAVTRRRHHLARRVSGPEAASHAVDLAREHLCRALTALVIATQAREVGTEPDAVDLYDALSSSNAAVSELTKLLGMRDG